MKTFIQFYKTAKIVFGEMGWQRENWGKGKKIVDPISKRLEHIQKHLDEAKASADKGEDASALVKIRVIAGIAFLLLMRKDTPSRS